MPSACAAAVVFDSVMRRMRRWAQDESDQGPVYLGYRIGHVKGDSRLFRAVVYNKGAAVLHMLRLLLGDRVFFAGIRRFYERWRFDKAGIDDLRQAMEAEARDPADAILRAVDLRPDSSPGGLQVAGGAEGRNPGGACSVSSSSASAFDVPVRVTLDYLGPGAHGTPRYARPAADRDPRAAARHAPSRGGRTGTTRWPSVR